MKRTILILAAVLIVLAGGVYAILQLRSRSSNTRFATPYQAVLLDTGQVYFGKIQGLDTSFPLLTEVYYVEHQVNPQTKEERNILVRRGNEWHAPDRMVINARHIVLVEPVNPTSKVADLISQLQSKNR